MRDGQVPRLGRQVPCGSDAAFAGTGPGGHAGGARRHGEEGGTAGASSPATAAFFEHLPGYQAKPTGIIVVTLPLTAGSPKGSSAPVQEGVCLNGNIIARESWGIWSTPQNLLAVGANVAVGISNQL